MKTVEQIKSELEASGHNLAWTEDYNMEGIAYIVNEEGGDVQAAHDWEYANGGGCYERACMDFQIDSSPEQEHNEYNYDDYPS